MRDHRGTHDMSGPTYCVHCGAKLLPVAQFCAGCGHAIDATERERNQGSNAEGERLIVNWLRVGTVASWVVLLAIDVAINGWVYPSMSLGWQAGLITSSLLVWSAAIGAVAGRRREAIWLGHSIGLLLLTVFAGVLAGLDLGQRAVAIRMATG